MKYTMRQISEAQQAFREIQVLPKGPKIALKMLNHQRQQIQPHLDALMTYLKEVLPKYTGGEQVIDASHENYAAFKAEYEIFLDQEIDMEPYPVKLETLINAVEVHNMQVATINKRFSDPAQRQPLIKLSEHLLGQLVEFFPDTMATPETTPNDKMRAVPEESEE